MDTKDQNSGIPETLAPNPVAGSLESEFQNVPLEEKVPESEQLQAEPRTPLQDSLRHFRHDLSLGTRAIREGDCDHAGTIDHMTAGQDVAKIIDDHAAAQTEI